MGVNVNHQTWGPDRAIYSLNPPKKTFEAFVTCSTTRLRQDGKGLEAFMGTHMRELSNRRSGSVSSFSFQCLHTLVSSENWAPHEDSVPTPQINQLGWPRPKDRERERIGTPSAKNKSLRPQGGQRRGHLKKNPGQRPLEVAGDYDPCAQVSDLQPTTGGSVNRCLWFKYRLSVQPDWTLTDLDSFHPPQNQFLHHNIRRLPGSSWWTGRGMVAHGKVHSTSQGGEEKGSGRPGCLI